MMSLLLWSLFLKTVLYMGGGAYWYMSPQAADLEVTGFNKCKQQFLTDVTDKNAAWAEFKEFCEFTVWKQDEASGSFTKNAYRWWYKDRVQMCKIYTRCRAENEWHPIYLIGLWCFCLGDYFSILIVACHYYSVDIDRFEEEFIETIVVTEIPIEEQEEAMAYPYTEEELTDDDESDEDDSSGSLRPYEIRRAIFEELNTYRQSK